MQFLFSTLSLFITSACAASLTQVSDFGDNPGNDEMYIYVPDSLASEPAVILALHPCGGDGPSYFEMFDFHTPADQGGFILLYPSAPHDNNCWDVATTETLTHNGGSDSLSLVNMVKYALTQYNGDPSQVYVTGSSSGAMMTNVLVATYPDVFVAAAAFSGVPYGCLAGSPGSSPTTADPSCANGLITKSGAEWAAMVKNAYPGYNGTYPRTQIWHGEADTFVSYHDFGEELKEWSTVFGLSNTVNNTNTPLSGYTQIVYGDGSQLVGYSAAGVGHFVPTDVNTVLGWFGLS
ncbi:feruloyl esterase B precursor [Penicillium riverlandense]|uniref:feruloyl esterase B precursor n=1 Tax=Penicillium riverlandense TaxID=1903569 RepID=UPI0025476C47|nr:feruloyl esterase B precursor [Penicillium riverlandense]KAJ5826136.1 feruloyl esterase B precursor [Penicillium riverlandense]